MDPLLERVATFRGGQAMLHDAGTVVENAEAIARLAAVGTPEDRRTARYVLRAAAVEGGAYPASIARFYRARARGEVSGFTVPAVNVRGLTFDTARALFRAMRATDAIAVFELNRAEVEFTAQEPDEFAALVLAAALAERYSGPVFLQGDHFQFRPAAYAADPERETFAVEELTRKAIAAGFYNIDIDASTLVDLSFSSVAEQQALNAALTARLMRLIRHAQPPDIEISVGGEIGEVGAHNSTAEELVAYTDAVRRLSDEYEPGMTKISIQAGTSHGGVLLPDGSTADVAIDFDTVRGLSTLARERYGMAGVVQHGASTLPDALFHLFREAGTAEVHLATGFQDIVFDHPHFPPELLASVYDYVERAHGGERDPGETDERFLRRLRRKAWGPMKAALLDLPPGVRDSIGASLESRFAFVIEQLGAAGLRETAGRYLTHVPAEPAPSG